MNREIVVADIDQLKAMKSFLEVLKTKTGIEILPADEPHKALIGYVAFTQPKGNSAEELAAFEEEFATYCGVKHCIGVGCGLDALPLALKAVGIGPGAEVITAANTFIATALSIHHASATPVLVDCDPETYNLDPRRLSRAITSRTTSFSLQEVGGRSESQASLAAPGVP